VSFSPGTVFGEIVFLDAGLRAATAAADDDVVCYVLTLEAFERLRTSSAEVRALSS
jgi:CRP-like cAMP-binding protein